jgi:hypothetical protein
MEMSAVFPVALLFMTGIVWCATTYQHYRLFRAFTSKYPLLAQKEIPFAFSTTAHPEKIFYFFRRRALEFLSTDKEIWKLRQRFLLFSMVSFCVPVGGCGAIVIYGLIHS